MKKINLLLIVLIAFVSNSNSQVNSNIDFPNQKRVLDSIILAHQKPGLQKYSFVGGDSILQTYKGLVWFDQSNTIKRIELSPDSIAAKIILFCINNKVVAVKENNNLFYNMKNHFYTQEGVEETAQASLAKFRRYDSIAQITKRIFNPDAAN